VAILLKIYAKCLDGQDAISERRIEEALGDPARATTPTRRPRMAEDFNAYSTQTAVGDRQGP
jgi:hypothetical protein